MECDAALLVGGGTIGRPRNFCTDQCKGRYKMREWKYGLTADDFRTMLAEQGGRCAICGGTEPGPRNWHIDHDHAFGHVRGLLCHKCNVGLGHFDDSVDRLRAAVRYLEASQPRLI
jgi:hypothetical protein